MTSHPPDPSPSGRSSTPDPGRRPRLRAAARVVATGAAVAALSLTAAGTASAHVHLLADSTAAGSDSALTFRVPNEAATADTVKVSVLLPQHDPFLSVSAKPVPGWKITETEARLPKPQQEDGATITKAVRSVTWTADRGSEIMSGQYQEFSLSVAPLPGPGPVELPAIQTYSDGSVVKWNQPTPASGTEPEHPVPILVVTAAEPTGDSAGAATAEAATPSAGTTASARTSPVPGTHNASEAVAPDRTARWLAGGALVLSAVAVALASLGISRSRSSRTA